MAPAVVTLASTASLVLLFLTYGNAIRFTPDQIVALMSSLEDGQADMLATRVVMTNLVLLAPLLVLARRWHLPAGTATICYGAAALISATLGDFADLTVPLTIVAAGVGVDVLARVLAPTGDRRIAFWGFAAAAGLLTWALYVGVAVVLVGVPAVAELWTGLPVITALVGLLLAILLLPNAQPRSRPRHAAPVPSERVASAAG